MARVLGFEPGALSILSNFSYMELNIFRLAFADFPRAAVFGVWLMVAARLHQEVRS